MTAGVVFMDSRGEIKEKYFSVDFIVGIKNRTVVEIIPNDAQGNEFFQKCFILFINFS